MVRLEKIAYEKIINSNTLKRARNITSPKKTDFFSELYLRRSPMNKLFHSIFAPLTMWMSSVEWKFLRSSFLQRGISFEDGLMTNDIDFRRGILNEQVNRESMHPYNQQLNMWKRSGFAKVDITMMGFEAPDYIQEDVRKQTYLDVYDKILKYKHFLLSNYLSELTPTTYMGRGSLVILDLFIVHNLFSRSAWNRFFFNEEEYVDSRKNMVDFESKMTNSVMNISTENGRKNFEAYLTKVNKRYPGMLAPEGEQIDFKSFYEKAEKAKLNPDNSSVTTDELTLLFEGQEKAFMVPEGEGLKGKNVVGKSLPGYLRSSTKALMQ